MPLADDIEKRGFQRWHERQLLESHLYLVTCLLCMVAVFAVFEAVTFRNGILRALPLLFTGFASGVIGWFAWIRYMTMMARAWRLADAATCAKCSAYGRLRVVGGSHAPPAVYDERGAIAPADPGAEWVRVQCKRCGNEWSM